MNNVQLILTLAIFFGLVAWNFWLKKEAESYKNSLSNVLVDYDKSLQRIHDTYCDAVINLAAADMFDQWRILQQYPNPPVDLKPRFTIPDYTIYHEETARFKGKPLLVVATQKCDEMIDNFLLQIPRAKVN